MLAKISHKRSLISLNLSEWKIISALSGTMCTWAMAEWIRRIRNQFDHDGRKNNHGGIWTWRSILVQGSIGCTWCSQCDLQGAHQHYSLAADAWWDARCLSISCIQVQGMGLSRQRQTRKWQAYATRSWGNQSRIRTQHKRIWLLYSGEEQLNDIESSEIWWYSFPFRKQKMVEQFQSDWLWQFNRHTV